MTCRSKPRSGRCHTRHLGGRQRCRPLFLASAQGGAAPDAPERKFHPLWGKTVGARRQCRSGTRGVSRPFLSALEARRRPSPPPLQRAETGREGGATARGCTSRHPVRHPEENAAHRGCAGNTSKFCRPLVRRRWEA
jgi:hypothetical protein